MRTRRLLGLVAILLSIALGAVGCDSDAKMCESGEGAASALQRWQACNRSCVDHRNETACMLRNGAPAVAACMEGERVACGNACQGGHQPACGR